ncbi:hypothetical protein DFS33DRAFT_878986 [Desarmillaria ectypa]|nr:hypothetical protein DFS33DRAFT_878986 [Desarmillaria ectypa]
MANIDIDSAYVGAYLSTLLFGAYIVTAYHCSVVLYRRYKSKQPHMYLLGTHIALFLLIAWRCTVTIIRTLYGVVHLAPDGIINLHPIWSTWSLVENLPWVITPIVADAFLVYRTYVVWMQKYLIIVIPLLLFAADVAMGIYFLVGIANSSTTLEQLIHVTTAFAAVTLSANIVCTALISFRIWTVHRSISVTRQGLYPLSNIIALIVESAAVYTIVLITQIITMSLESCVYFVLFDIQSPIIGIVFSMIIIRVSEGQSHVDTVGTSTDDITWRHSTMEETAENMEIRLHTITDACNEDVEAQHADLRKVCTKTDHESTAYKPKFSTSYRHSTHNNTNS